MSHGEFDIADIEVNVLAEVVDITLDIHIEPVNMVISLVENIGPPGVKGDQGETGPVDPSLADHVISELPHPIYDDGASFVLLYENAKV